MIQDPHPNTYGHCFSVEKKSNIDEALTTAITRYTDRWGIRPVNLFVHPSLLGIKSNQVTIIPYPRIPTGMLWFEVPVEFVKGENGR